MKRPTIDDLISPEPMSGCWLWLGNISRGYARFGKDAKRVHRLMWEREHGAIPDHLVVCHKCDVPCCVNPDHLFVGTQRDNLHDMIRKGRAFRGDNGRAKRTHCPAGHPFDDANTYWRPNGRRMCMACNRDRAKKYYHTLSA